MSVAFSRKIYPFEIFTRATPGSYLVMSYLYLPYPNYFPQDPIKIKTPDLKKRETINTLAALSNKCLDCPLFIPHYLPSDRHRV